MRGRMKPMSIAHRCALLLATVTSVLLAATHASAQEARVESLPTSGALGIENVRLPKGEHMGLVGGTLLFDIGGDWGLGPAVYGAASGHRGGFFVTGVELQRRWRLGPGLALATGLYAGGGGGAGAPVGGGLMLRPAVTLWKDLGPSLQFGLSWSSVRFPGGTIAGNQVGIALGWRQEFMYLDESAGTTVPPLDRALGLGFDRMVATAQSYRLDDGSGRRIGLAGARAERRSNIDGLTWGLEAAAAAKGGAAGYAEILGTAGLSIAPLPTALPTWRVGVRLGAGLAGGGAVATGGGLIGKAAATMEWSPWPGWTVGGELGRVRGVNGPLRARQAQLWVGLDLEPGLGGQAHPRATLVHTEWSGVLQHHERVERRDGTRQAIDTIGLKLNRYLGEHLYLSGQAHSAYAGGAGAYSVGLVGAGLAMRPAATLRLGAELLVGAAGGGGTNTAGGAIVQGLAWAGWSPSAVGEWRAGIGSMHPLHGGRSSPLIELSWSRGFGMAAP